MVRVLSVERPVLPSASAIAAASPDTSLTVITCPTASVAPETASTTRVVACANAPLTVAVAAALPLRIRRSPSVGAEAVPAS